MTRYLDVPVLHVPYLGPELVGKHVQLINLKGYCKFQGRFDV